jgi:hypothetical protein
MTDTEAKALFDQIQGAYVRKDLPGVIKYYHPDVSYIGPAFSNPLIGIDALKDAFRRYFEGPERSYATFKDIKVLTLSPSAFLVHCLVEGSSLIYLSDQRFRGYLSRAFVVGPDNTPLIIHEHFSLSSL